jgi:hypothetical protein
MASQTFEMRITGMPALIADLRREVARIICDAAEDEAPAVAARLLEIAAAFEAGQGVE